MRNTLNISRRRVPRQFGGATVGGQIPLDPPRRVFTRIGDTTVHLDNHGKAGGFSLPGSIQKFFILITSFNFYRILSAFQNSINSLTRGKDLT
ncbi:hypothetical protein [Dyadobacter sp. 3J3]|uniref:hypothetical protein n=1 Tax=Dyadobacter sp. 3J3 TaxID=2606600 RepID=UPI00135B2F51|nr:hypothetical protein [Dyadobacter sp. 3J3]